MKRGIFLILIYFLLGVVTTIATSWCIALWFPAKPLHSLIDIGPVKTTYIPRWHVDRALGFGSDWVCVEVVHVIPTQQNSIPQIPYWSVGQRQPTVDESVNGKWIIEKAYGVPFRALMYSMHANRWMDGRADTVSSLNISYRWPELPVGPIWPGFILDTVFFSLIIYGLVVSFVSLKRTIRTRRGSCKMCGYDLQYDFESGCPECGWRRE